MRCRCSPELSVFERQLIAGALYSALVTEYLIFRKNEWIEDCGFIIGEKLVEIPRGFDGKSAKIRCFNKCLELLDNGWSNEIAEKNRVMMIEYLKEHTDVK